MIKTMTAALAAAAMFTSVAAEAKCTCQPKRHKTSHHHRVKRHVVKRAVVPVVAEEVVVVKEVVKTDLCVNATPNYLPDPERPGCVPLPASAAENIIAEKLNASLDIWRTCGWSGYEEPVAAFVAWSRTHVTPDPMDPTHVQVAWKPYARASFGRTEALTDPIARSRYCADLRPERTQMRADMDRQMDALAKAHLASHRQ